MSSCFRVFCSPLACMSRFWAQLRTRPLPPKSTQFIISQNHYGTRALNLRVVLTKKWLATYVGQLDQQTANTAAGKDHKPGQLLLYGKRKELEWLLHHNTTNNHAPELLVVYNTVHLDILRGFCHFIENSKVTTNSFDVIYPLQQSMPRYLTRQLASFYSNVIPPSRSPQCCQEGMRKTTKVLSVQPLSRTIETDISRTQVYSHHYANAFGVEGQCKYTPETKHVKKFLGEPSA